MGWVDLESAAADLYGLTPEEFVSARDAAARKARAAGDRPLAAEIAKLRRPTLPAWLVNLLVRREGAAVEELLDLGDEMRTAQQGLDAAELRRLTGRRSSLIEQLSQRAVRLASEAGRPAAEQAQQEVASTLSAAVADPNAAEAVRQGRLTTALSYAGFGTLELEALPTRPPRREEPAARPAPDKQTRADRQRAEAELRLRQTELDAAGRALARAERRQSELEEALRSAREDLAAASAARDEAEQARDRAAAKLGAG